MIHIPRPPIPADTQPTIEDRFGKALSLLEKLVAEHPDIPDFRAPEARLQDKLGSFYRQMERWSEAEQNFRKAIALQSPLVKQCPDVPHYSLWMATFRIALADSLIRKDQTREARTELEDAISTLLQQQERRPETPRPYDLLALGYSKLAVALHEAGENDQVQAAARKAEQERNPVHCHPIGI